MPNTEIANLTDGSGVKPGDVLPSVRSGANRKAYFGEHYHAGYVAGRYRYIQPYPALTAGAALTPANILQFVPWPVHGTHTITDMRCRVTTGDAGKLLAVGIYAAGSDYFPTGNVLRGTDWTSQSLTSTGLLTCTLTSTLQVTAGLYWVAYQQDGTAAVIQSGASTNGFVGWLIGAPEVSVANGATNTTQSLTTTNTWGSFPDVTSSTWSSIASNRHALFYYPVTSVP